MRSLINKKVHQLIKPEEMAAKCPNSAAPKRRRRPPWPNLPPQPKQRSPLNPLLGLFLAFLVQTASADCQLSNLSGPQTIYLPFEKDVGYTYSSAIQVPIFEVACDSGNHTATTFSEYAITIVVEESGTSCTWGTDCDSSPFNQVTAIVEGSDNTYFDVSLAITLKQQMSVHFKYDMSQIAAVGETQTMTHTLDLYFCEYQRTSTSFFRNPVADSHTMYLYDSNGEVDKVQFEQSSSSYCDDYTKNPIIRSFWNEADESIERPDSISFSGTYLTIDASQLLEGSVTYTIQYSRSYEVPEYVNAVAARTEVFITETGTLTIVKCSSIPAYADATVFSLDSVVYSEYVSIAQASSSTVGYLWPTNPNSDAACDLVNTVTNDFGGTTDPDATFSLDLSTAVQGTITLTSHLNDGTQLGSTRTGTIFVCEYLEVDSDLFTSGSALEHFFVAGGPTSTTYTIQRVTNVATQTDISQCDITETGESDLHLAFVTAEDIDYLYIGSDENELVVALIDSTRDGEVMTLTYTAKLQSEVIGVKTATITLTECTYTDPPTVWVLFANVEAYIGGYEQVRTLDLTTVVATPDVNGCAVSYSATYVAPADTTVVEDLPNSVTFTTVTGAITHSFDFTYTAHFGSVIVFTATSQYNVYRCYWPEETTATLPDGTSTTEVIHLDPASTDEVHVVALTQNTWTEPYCAIATYRLVLPDDTTYTVTHNGDDLEVILNGATSLTGSVLVKVWAYVADVEDADTYYKAFRKDVTLEIYNCGTSEQSGFAMVQSDYQHFERTTTDTCSLYTSVAGAEGTGLQLIQFEADYTTDCANLQALQLVQFSVDPQCGSLTSSMVTDPSMSTAEIYLASDQKVWINLDLVNPSSPSVTFTVTITATNGYWTVPTTLAEITVIRCNDANSATQPNNYFLMVTGTSKQITLTENSNIHANCPIYTITVENLTLDNYEDWITQDFVTTNTVPNNSITITYDASIPKQGFNALRQMRDQTETFFFIVCELQEPSPILVTDPFIINIDESGDYSKYFYVNSFTYLPSDHEIQPISCPTFTPTIEPDNGQVLEDWDITAITCSGEISVFSTDVSQTRTFTYTASVASESFSIPLTFPVTVCKTPDIDAASVNLLSDTILDADGAYQVSISQDDTVSLSGILYTDLALCNIQYSITTTDASFQSWFTFDSTTLTLSLDADSTMTTQFRERIDVTIWALTSAGTADRTITIVVRDCLREVLVTDPSIDVTYAQIDMYTNVSLLADDWVIGDDSDELCKDYYFGLEFVRDDGEADYEVGGLSDSTASAPSWLRQWTQTQNADSGSAHFSFKIYPTSLSELYTYTATIRIYNSFSAVHESATFKIFLFQIKYAEEDEIAPMTALYETSTDNFQIPIQALKLDGSAIDTRIFISSNFVDMQNGGPSSDLNFGLTRYADGGVSFPDFFTLDTQVTPNSHYVDIVSGLEGTINWTSKSITLIFNWYAADENNDFITRASDGTRIAFGGRTITVELVDCSVQVVMAPGPDFLTLLTVASLNNERVFESATEDFTFVRQSGSGFQLQIAASTATYTDICGLQSNTVVLSEEDSFITFDDVDLITVNTDRSLDQITKVTVSVQNWFYTQELIMSTFEWVTCEGKSPTNGSGTYTDTTTELMFDFQTLTSTETVSMEGTGWTFFETYCFVNAWRITCTDPSSRQLVSDSLGYLSGSGDCDSFDFSLFLDGQLLDETRVPYQNDDFSFETLDTYGYQANIASSSIVKIGANSDNFNSYKEGVYTFEVSYWMQIDSTTVSDVQTDSSWTRKVQADCDSVNNLMTRKDTVTLSPENASVYDTITHKIQEPSELSYGNERPYEITFYHTCEYTLSIIDESTATLSYMVVDETNHKIQVQNTLNSDYPLITGDKPTQSKLFKLRGEVPSSLIFFEIPFYVQFTLNCHATVLTLVEPEQVLAPVTFIQSPNVEGLISLSKVTLSLAQNSNCDLFLENYSIVQLGYNSTVVNPEWPGTGDYDPTLVSPLEQSADQTEIVIRFKTHIITDGQMPLKTYDPDTSTICDLEDVNTLSCTQEFWIYVESYTGIIARIATVTVTFQTECYELQNTLLAGDTPIIESFTWSVEQKYIFDAGYTIRDPQTNVQMPLFTPELDSGRDVHVVCGQMQNTIVDPNQWDYPTNPNDPINEENFVSLFLNIQPAGFGNSITPSFDVFSEDVYKTNHVDPYEKVYSFTLLVEFELYNDIKGTYPEPLNFKISDTCLGATFSSVSHYLHQASVNGGPSSPTTKDLYFEQGVLSDPTVFLIQLHDYTSSTDVPIDHEKCGTTVYTTYWLNENGNQIPVPAVTEDRTKLFERITGETGYNHANGLQPLAMRSNATLNDQIGEYRFVIEARLSKVNIEEIKFVKEITLNITACVTTSVEVVDLGRLQTVYIGTTATVKINSFVQTPACNYTWTYENALVTTSSDQIRSKSLAQLRRRSPTVQITPSPITKESTSRPSVEILFYDYELVGEEYYLYFAGELDYYKSLDPCCLHNEKQFAVAEGITIQLETSKDLIFNTSPKISVSPREVTLEVGQSEVLTFELEEDIEFNNAWLSNFITRSTNRGNFDDFVTLKNDTDINLITVEIDVPEDENAATFSIEFTFQDDHLVAPAVIQKSVTVTVLKPKEEEVIDFEFQVEREEAERAIQDSGPPPKMKISNIDDKGKIKVSFDQPIQLSPDFAIEIDRRRRRFLQVEELAELNSNNGGGEIFLVEYQPSKRSLSIQELEEIDVQVGWTVQPINDRGFYIVLNFTKTEYVSQFKTSLDSLTMEIVKPEVFINVYGKPAEAEKTEEKIRKLQVPTLVTPDYVDVEVVGILQDSFAAAVKTVMAGNLIISLLLATALQYLWGMINALQIIVLGVLFSSLQPPNAAIVQYEILKACAFDFFQTETIYNEIFDFKKSESFSEPFDEAEIQGSNFVVGIGPIFIFMVYQIFFQLLYYLMRCCCKGKQIRTKFLSNFIAKERHFSHIWLIFFLEGCVEVGIMCGVCFTMMNADRVSNFSETFSTVLAVFMALALLAAPIYMFIIGNQIYKAKIEGDRKKVKHLEPLFANKRLRNWFAIQHNLLFFVRRYMLMAAIVFFPENLFLQITIQVHFTLIMLCYTYTQRPNREPNMNRQEILNEMTVLAASYLLYLYNENVWEAETRYEIGWIHIYILMLNLFLNVAIMIIEGARPCQLKCKRRYNIKQAKKQANLQRAIRIERLSEQEQRQQDLLEMFPDMHDVLERSNEESYSVDSSLESPQIPVAKAASQNVRKNDLSSVIERPPSDESEVFMGSLVVDNEDSSVATPRQTGPIVITLIGQKGQNQLIEAKAKALIEKNSSKTSQAVVSSKKGKKKKSVKTKHSTFERFGTVGDKALTEQDVHQSPSNSVIDVKNKFDLLVKEAETFLDAPRIIDQVDDYPTTNKLAQFYEPQLLSHDNQMSSQRNSERAQIINKKLHTAASFGTGGDLATQRKRDDYLNYGVARTAALQQQNAKTDSSRLLDEQKRIVMESRRQNMIADPIGLIKPRLMRQANSMGISNSRRDHPHPEIFVPQQLSLASSRRALSHVEERNSNGNDAIKNGISRFGGPGATSALLVSDYSNSYRVRGGAQETGNTIRLLNRAPRVE